MCPVTMGRYEAVPALSPHDLWPAASFIALILGLIMLFNTLKD